MLRKLADVQYTPGAPGTPDVTTCTDPPPPPPSPPPSPPPNSGGACALGYGTIPFCMPLGVINIYAPGTGRELPEGAYVISYADGSGYTYYSLCLNVYTCLDFAANWYPDP